MMKISLLKTCDLSLCMSNVGEPSRQRFFILRWKLLHKIRFMTIIDKMFSSANFSMDAFLHFPIDFLPKADKRKNCPVLTISLAFSFFCFSLFLQPNFIFQKIHKRDIRTFSFVADFKTRKETKKKSNEIRQQMRNIQS